MYEKKNVSAVVLNIVTWCDEFESKQGSKSAKDFTTWMWWRNSSRTRFRKKRTAKAQWEACGKKNRQYFWEDRKDNSVVGAKIIFCSCKGAGWWAPKTAPQVTLCTTQRHALEQKGTANCAPEPRDFWSMSLHYCTAAALRCHPTTSLPENGHHLVNTHFPMLGFLPNSNPYLLGACPKARRSQTPRWVHLPLTFDSG